MHELENVSRAAEMDSENGVAELDYSTEMDGRRVAKSIVANFHPSTAEPPQARTKGTTATASPRRSDAVRKQIMDNFPTATPKKQIFGILDSEFKGRLDIDREILMDWWRVAPTKLLGMTIPRNVKKTLAQLLLDFVAKRKTLKKSTASSAIGGSSTTEETPSKRQLKSSTATEDATHFHQACPCFKPKAFRSQISEAGITNLRSFRLFKLWSHIIFGRKLLRESTTHGNQGQVLHSCSPRRWHRIVSSKHRTTTTSSGK